MSLNSAKFLKPTQESLRNSFALRSSKVFINENDRCVILDSQNLIENIRTSVMKTSQKVSPRNSLVNSSSNFNLRASSVLQNRGNLTFFNKKQIEGVEKIINDNPDEEKLNILSCTDVIERNEKWLKEKMKKTDKLKKEKEAEEIKECSFNPTLLTKGYRSSSNSRFTTLFKNSEASVFSSHRSIISSNKITNHNINNNTNQSTLDAKYEKLKIRGNILNSKWYVHDSYKKEFEKKKEFSNKK